MYAVADSNNEVFFCLCLTAEREGGAEERGGGAGEQVQHRARYSRFNYEVKNNFQLVFSQYFC
jgi:hypothetical protein